MVLFILSKAWLTASRESPRFFSKTCLAQNEPANLCILCPCHCWICSLIWGMVFPMGDPAFSGRSCSELPARFLPVHFEKGLLSQFRELFSISGLLGKQCCSRIITPSTAFYAKPWLKFASQYMSSEDMDKRSALRWIFWELATSPPRIDVFTRKMANRSLTNW